VADLGIKIVERDGVFHLAGVLNEYADLSPLLKEREPLLLNMAQVSRLNSIGIRNLLKFLSDWGPKRFTYEACPSEFVDQINMIPALLGTKGNGAIKSLFVPYECESCEHEEDFLGTLQEYVAALKAGALPKRKCPKCGNMMAVLSDSFFVFLNR
jgi:ribosomal protein S27E